MQPFLCRVHREDQNKSSSISGTDPLHPSLHGLEPAEGTSSEGPKRGQRREVCFATATLQLTLDSGSAACCKSRTKNMTSSSRQTATHILSLLGPTRRAE